MGASRSAPRVDLPALVGLAEQGLANMFDRERNLFCFTLKRTDRGLERQGYSYRYTMMALLGLHKLESTRGRRASLPVQDICNRLVGDLGWVNNIGDLGLLLWLCALVSAEHVSGLCERAAINEALGKYPDGRRRSTTELAWFLTGLAYAIKSDLPATRGLESSAEKVCRLLLDNQGAHGFFGHLARGTSVAGLMRGRIGSFADQVYPIYALAKFGHLYGRREPVERARQCAEAICRVQGTLGQWWWHYDAGTGRVVQRFPVYSVHQLGMAPMALSALADATCADVREPIRRGLEWIGNNELRQDLRAPHLHVVWRDVEDTRRWSMYLHEAVEFLTSRAWVPGRNLTINHECRPYELGWLLYAFGDAKSRPA